MCPAPILRLAPGERLQPGAGVLPNSQLRRAVPPAVHPLALEVAQWLVHRWCGLHANRVRSAAPGCLAHGRARPVGRPARAHGAVAGVMLQLGDGNRPQWTLDLSRQAVAKPNLSI